LSESDTERNDAGAMNCSAAKTLFVVDGSVMEMLPLASAPPVSSVGVSRFVMSRTIGADVNGPAVIAVVSLASSAPLTGRAKRL
jgi:hypothetical protein